MTTLQPCSATQSSNIMTLIIHAHMPLHAKGIGEGQFMHQAFLSVCCAKIFSEIKLMKTRGAEETSIGRKLFRHRFHNSTTKSHLRASAADNNFFFFFFTVNNSSKKIKGRKLAPTSADVLQWDTLFLCAV